MKTRISVIIPIYNVQEFLEDCIDSVLAQTIIHRELNDGYERNLQIILVDDGSTDDSAKIAKRYANDFENVEYVYEENQGLGHARNYGCQFAEGDYIIFLDSDDMVTPKAYERMYDAAIKNNSDMTIGSVLRFNSKRYWTIDIHRKAFSGTKDVTHITESPELFYDTTSWNKFIKRSFWNEHHFEFPEGILYEDIPVTMPMHFLANNVSIIYEPCYLWRVREGLSKSITQTTDDTKNLNDRLTVMGMVDEFYEDNVDDPLLNQVKSIKWLKIDLMIFINKLKSISKDDSKDIIKIISDYIHNNINLDDLKYLNEIERLKYEYLLDNDYDSLVKLLNFEFEDLKFTKVYSKNSHLMMDGDKEIFKDSSFFIDKYIEDSKQINYIQKVALKSDQLIVKGFTLIPGLEITDFKDRQYSIYLVNSKSHKKIKLDYEDVKTGKLDSFNIKYGDSFSYDSSGYQVHIPYSELINDPDFVGENRILISFKQKGITHNYFAGITRKNVRRSSEFKARIYENTYFSINYDLNTELIFVVSPIKHIYDNVAIENNKLCIYSSNNGNLFLCYDKDSINKEYKIPLDYDSKEGCYSIDIEDISKIKGQIRYENGEPIVNHNKKQFYLFSDKGQVIINALRDYHFDIYRTDNVSIVSEIYAKNSIVNLTVELHSIKNILQINNSKLYFKDKKSFEIYELSEGKFVKDKHSIEFSIDLSNQNITKNLFQGVHDIYIEYETDDLSFSTPVYLKGLFNFKYVGKSFDYSVYRSGKSTLRIRSTRKWSKREDTKIKRENNANKIYKYLRYLPIKRNRIMFESMWGANYSCNPRYLYEYIDKNHPKYECVWSLKDEHTPIKGNGIRVRRNSIKYFYYLATSKFFVNNVNFHDHYVKRKNQIEIQTMHGTPLKTLGLDVPGDFKTKKEEMDFLKKCSRWDYLTVQSDFVSEISKRAFNFKKKLLNYGYPRTDILYSKNNEKDINKLKEKMNLPLDKKIILYAPTWRLRNKFDLMLDLKSFKRNLSDEYILILRLHHFSLAGWKQPEQDEFVYDFSRYDSIEELFLVSDLLVTDYSSVMFDYSILDRPILLFTYDMEEYGEKLRGFYIDIAENKPGPIVYTSKELEDAILNIDDVEKETNHFRQKFRKKFLQYESGDSSEKIFNEVMKK